MAYGGEKIIARGTVFDFVHARDLKTGSGPPVDSAIGTPPMRIPGRCLIAVSNAHTKRPTAKWWSRADRSFSSWPLSNRAQDLNWFKLNCERSSFSGICVGHYCSHQRQSTVCAKSSAPTPQGRWIVVLRATGGTLRTGFIKLFNR